MTTYPTITLPLYLNLTLPKSCPLHTYYFTLPRWPSSYPLLHLTLPKVALFRADRPDEFMAELLARVDIEQAQ